MFRTLYRFATFLQLRPYLSAVAVVFGALITLCILVPLGAKDSGQKILFGGLTAGLLFMAIMDLRNWFLKHSRGGKIVFYDDLLGEWEKAIKDFVPAPREHGPVSQHGLKQSLESAKGNVPLMRIRLEELQGALCRDSEYLSSEHLDRFEKKIEHQLGRLDKFKDTSLHSVSSVGMSS